MCKCQWCGVRVGHWNCPVICWDDVDGDAKDRGAFECWLNDGLCECVLTSRGRRSGSLLAGNKQVHHLGNQTACASADALGRTLSYRRPGSFGMTYSARTVWYETLRGKAW